MAKQGKQNLIILFVLLLGLVPLLWFKGELITGTDVDFPLYPEDRLVERLSTWYPEIQFGVDRSNNLGSLPFVLVAFLFSRLDISLITVEKLTFIFWFALTGFSMLFLMNRILDDEKNDKWGFYAKLFAILIYMINFYNMFLWVRLQMAVTIMFALPIFIGIMITILDKNRLSRVDVFLMSLIFIVGSSLGIQPPIAYALLLMSVFLVFYYFLFDIVKRDFRVIWSKTKKIFLVATIAVLSGLYWMVPLGNLMLSSGLTDSAAGKEIYNVESLLAWTSTFTSFKNVFRQLGDIIWYDGWSGAAYFPEFIKLDQNSIFTLLSFLLPVAFVLSLAFKDHINKKTLLAIGGVTLISLYFSKGTHPPFEEIFKFAFNKLPGFWVHRAPWQKFGIFATLGLAVLGGIGFARGLGILFEKQKLIKKAHQPFYYLVVFLVISSIYIWVNNLFVFGTMFPSRDSDIGYHGKFDLGYHQTFPDYVFDTGKFLESQKYLFNVMVLPDMNANVYSWGYGGSSDVLNLVSSRGSLFNTYGEGFTLTDDPASIYQGLIEILYNKGNYDLNKIAGFFNIGYILQRNDFRYDFFGDTDSPAFIKDALGHFSIEKERNFGEWDLYKINKDNFYPAVYATTSVVDIKSISAVPLYAINAVNYGETQVFVGDEDYETGSNEQIVITVPPKTDDEEKKMLSDLYWSPGWVLPEANVAPNSIAYPLVRLREKTDLKKYAKDSDDYLDTLLWYTSKKAVELSSYEYLPDYVANNLLDAFVAGHEEIVSRLEDDLLNQNPDFWYSPDIIRKILGYHQRSLFMLSRIDRVPQSTIDYLYEIYDRYVRVNTNRTDTTCLDFCYEVVVERPGNYQLSFVFNDYSLLDQPSDSVILTIRNVHGTNLYSGPLNKIEKNQYFETGEYFVSLDLDEKKNLTDEIPVEEISLTQEDNLLLKVPDLRPTLRTFPVNNIKRFVVEDAQGLDGYDFSFRYNADSGFLGVAVFEEGVDGNYTLRYINGLKGPNELGVGNQGNLLVGSNSELCVYFDVEKCFSEFNAQIKSTPNSKRLHFYVFSYGPVAAGVEMGLESLLLTANTTPNLVLESGKPAYSGSAPDIRFYRVNPTKYKVQVTNSNQPFYLILNQTFDSGWKLYKGGSFAGGDLAGTYLDGSVTEFGDVPGGIFETFGLQQIAGGDHYKANYFGNAWYIDPSGYGDTYELTIEFFPQNMFYIGSLVSAGVFVVVSTAVVWRRKRSDKK